jgi:UDP-N-acetyl-D-galactosamine dehydrogenase
MLGITFKENCPDVRNTKIVDVINALKQYGIKITIFDPWANPEEVIKEYNLNITNILPNRQFDSVILGVSHKEFFTLQISDFLKSSSVFYDVKGIFSSNADGTL